MKPDLSNTSDVDIEGWLAEANEAMYAFMDKWEASPESVSATHSADVVYHLKALILAMQEALKEPEQAEAKERVK